MRSLEKNFEGAERLSIISDFDFYNLNLVQGFRLERENTGQTIQTYKVSLEMLYECEQSTFEVLLELTGVRHLTFPNVCGGFCLSEIEVDDISTDQLEGVKYRLKDYGGTGFEVLSRGFSVIRCNRQL
ncbi:hypothetical protein [Pseudomonas sp. Xaverov 83]|uniref:hypothetical protein n=1 Tax=Pseudomonas sp. Xaverov 83 TaxID=2666087 RepID=UPI001C5A754C|nr:hypothetical protein [Pseudomonas sp. Xaverov 83]